MSFLFRPWLFRKKPAKSLLVRFIGVAIEKRLLAVSTLHRNGVRVLHMTLDNLLRSTL